MQLSLQCDKKSTASATAAAVKKSSRNVELPVETRSHALTAHQLNALLEGEGKMAAADRMENDRINSKVSHRTNSSRDCYYVVENGIRIFGEMSGHHKR